MRFAHLTLQWVYAHPDLTRLAAIAVAVLTLLTPWLQQFSFWNEWPAIA